MLEKSMVTAIRSFWSIQEMQFLNPTGIGSLSQHAGVRLQLSMTNVGAGNSNGTLRPPDNPDASNQRRL